MKITTGVKTLYIQLFANDKFIIAANTEDSIYISPKMEYGNSFYHITIFCREHNKYDLDIQA